MKLMGGSLSDGIVEQLTQKVSIIIFTFGRLKFIVYKRLAIKLTKHINKKSNFANKHKKY